MATAAEYEERICTLDWSFGLRLLWWAMEHRDVPYWAPGKALEYLVLRAFQLEGAEVQWPYGVTLLGEQGIEQIDGAIYCDGLSCLVECKDERERVSFEPISKLRAQMTRRPAGVLGLVFSMSGFTEPARVLAHFTAPQSVLLWYGDEISYALKKRQLRRGLVAKYRAFVESGTPDNRDWMGDN